GYAKQPLRIEPLNARVHAGNQEVLTDLAVAVDVAGNLLRLVQHQALQKSDHLAPFLPRQGEVGLARGERLTAVPADPGVGIQTGAIMAVGCRRAHAPQRRCAEVADDAAIELYLVEVRPNVVILEIAVDAPHRVRPPPRQPALPPHPYPSPPGGEGRNV